MTKHKIAKHRCGDLILIALDYWTAAYTVHCDPYPLSAHGELQALRDDRKTYQMETYGVRHRNAWRIRSKPPGKATVLTEHRCHHPLPQDWLAPPEPTKPRPQHQEVPF